MIGYLTSSLLNILISMPSRSIWVLHPSTFCLLLVWSWKISPRTEQPFPMLPQLEPDTHNVGLDVPDVLGYVGWSYRFWMIKMTCYIQPCVSHLTTPTLFTPILHNINEKASNPTLCSQIAETCVKSNTSNTFPISGNFFTTPSPH